MAEELYLYAVARIRSKEMSLLGKPEIEQLLSSKKYEDCLRILIDRGWGKSGSNSAEKLLAAEREKTWELAAELVEDMSVFNTFLYEHDYHNLKAAIKETYTNKRMDGIYISYGTVDPEIIRKAVNSHDFALLPEHMRTCAEEAYQILLHTGDSQLCDIVVDRAALDMIYKSGKASGNGLLADYAEIKIAAADIKIALRSSRTGKNRDFLERAIAVCDSLDSKKLIRSALEGEEEICSYLAATVYAGAVQALKDSPSAFESWCDNLLIEKIKPQKYNPFTISPVAAYILARENEIKTVRILLSGKLNNLPEESIRGRLREMYV